jgi:hypothetical protein
LSSTQRVLSDSTTREPSTSGVAKDLSALSSRFTMLRELQAANKARCFLAYDRTTGGRQPLMLTVFNAHAAEEPGDLLAFLVEAHAAATLSHKNIAASSKPQQIEGIHFYLSQYPDNAQSLRDLLDQQGWFDVAAFLRIAGQLALALQYAQQLEVLHLKLQPGYVLLDKEQNVTLIGFGIPNSPSRQWAQQKRSQECPMVYRSPEQLANNPLDGRSDLYALGVLLYEMLTDMLPFYAEQEKQLQQKIALQKAPAAHLIRPEIPESLSAIVAKLLAANPAERFADAAALRAALAQVIEAPARSPLQAEPPQLQRQTLESGESQSVIDEAEAPGEAAIYEFAANDESVSLIFYDAEVIKNPARGQFESLSVERADSRAAGGQSKPSGLLAAAAGVFRQVRLQAAGRLRRPALLIAVLAMGVLMITAGLAYRGLLKNHFKAAAVGQADLNPESLVRPTSEEASTISGMSGDSRKGSENPAAQASQTPAATGNQASDDSGVHESAPGKAGAAPGLTRQPGRPDTAKLRQELRRANQTKVAKQKVRKNYSPAKTRKAKSRRGLARLRFW